MLSGLTRELRWRNIREETPQKMTAFIVAYFNPEDKALVRDALWDGTKFVINEYPYRPLRTVTHWMPYPSLPPAREMRRVFRLLFGDAGAREPS